MEKKLISAHSVWPLKKKSKPLLFFNTQCMVSVLAIYISGLVTHVCLQEFEC